MHDLRALRDDPASYDRNWARRGLDPQAAAILDLDEQRRAAQTAMQALLQQRNEKSKLIGQLKAKGEDAQGAMDDVAALKTRVAELEQAEAALGEALTDRLASLPNLLDDDVPDGMEEEFNLEVQKFGEPRLLNTPSPDHVAIGEGLGMMDFETAAKMSGSRFVLMKGPLARLERALAQFMLDTHTQEHAYTEVSPPLLVKDNALYGTGQLPKFAEDLFRTTSGHWLIPTSEVSLTNMMAETITDVENLPLRITACTPCFRSEAGAAGKDTRGMIRQHQFYKVEMVSVTLSSQSNAELDRMTACAETILKKLNLSFRTVLKCLGDTGPSAKKSFDIEVWLPGQQKYREISSCSNCGDFQARRMKARCRAKGEKDTQFVHTLNGSGVAVGRALVAVLENYYDPADGGVFVPGVLKPYMGGLDKIVRAE